MYPPPTDKQILAILDKHRSPTGAVELSPHEGSVNHVRMVGDLCVRALKEEAFASDIYTETVAVPALRASGAAVPELLAFDESRDIVPGLVTIYRRLPGIPLGLSTDKIDELSFNLELGRQISLWSQRVVSVEDPNGWLDKPRLDNAWGCLERNADRLSAAERTWTESILRRLEAAHAGPNVFVHWDLHSHNILVDQSRFVAVIDWGDAGFGEAAINYHCLPTGTLPIVLEPLGEIPHHLIGRCLYATLAYALNDIHREENPNQPYRNVGHRRWRSFASLYTQNLSESWRTWLDDPPPMS